jgi:hypothetical protein
VKAPYHECPSFEVCSCNLCPLDPDLEMRTGLPGEEKCRAHKPTRLKIACRYLNLLKYQGLTVKEWVGLRSWSALSEEERGRVKGRLNAYSRLQKTKQNSQNP